MWSRRPIVNLRRSTTATTCEYKVWSADRKQKKLVSATSIQELIQKGNLVYLTYSNTHKRISQELFTD